MNNDIAVLGTQHSGQCSKYTVKCCRDEAIVSTPVRVIVLLSTGCEVGFFCHKRRGYLISLLFKLMHIPEDLDTRSCGDISHALSFGMINAFVHFVQLCSGVVYYSVDIQSYLVL